MEGYRFHHDLRVRWSEVDGQQIVFNANYMNYMDIAYAEYLRRDLKLVKGMPATVMAKSTLEFKQSGRFDDELHIWVRTSRIGRSSMTVDFAITRDGDELLLTAQTVYVYIDDQQRPISVPDAWREAIETYEER